MINSLERIIIKASASMYLPWTFNQTLKWNLHFAMKVYVHQTWRQIFFAINSNVGHSEPTRLKWLSGDKSDQYQ